MRSATGKGLADKEGFVTAKLSEMMAELAEGVGRRVAHAHRYVGDFAIKERLKAVKSRIRAPKFYLM